jgi:uncharacterized protein (TIGR03790 family)
MVSGRGPCSLEYQLNRRLRPRRSALLAAICWALLAKLALPAQTADQVLLVVNRNDSNSRQIGEYYAARRSLPARNVCFLETTTDEEIQWTIYEQQIEKPVAKCLQQGDLRERILYIATTLGVPLKINGHLAGLRDERASVDSELTLLYSKMNGAHFTRSGGIANPFFMKRQELFQHPRFPIYLVTRLAAYDLAGVKSMIDRSLMARNHGKFVVDLNSASNQDGNNWLRTAALLLPGDRVVIDETNKVLYDQKDVIGYAAWGSNDSNRRRRFLGFQWLPGAIATEFVSTNARTLKRPPQNWTFTSWQDKDHWFGGSPQGLSADLILEGATGVTGNVYEPFLQACARPDYLLPAYFNGRNLAESYYLSIPLLSWQGVLFGDPLASLGKP